MRRLLAVSLGAVLTLAFVLLAALGFDAFRPPAPNPDIRPAHVGPPAWKVTRRYSVNRVLIVEGESDDLERGQEIATWLVGSSAEAYDEVLVYVRPPDKSRTRRVQWTKKDGFRVLDF